MSTTPPRRHPVLRWLRILLGGSLLVLGVIGLFLPFLQGVLFLGMGISVLSTESRRVRRWVAWARSSPLIPERWRIPFQEQPTE